MSYNAKNYTEQGGNKTVIGGILEIKEGAEVTGLPTPTIPDATTSTKGVVKQAATQADSTAETVEALVSDFNSLLSKLKTAGIVASE